MLSRVARVALKKIIKKLEKNVESFTIIRSDDSQQLHMKAMESRANEAVRREFFYSLDRELEKVNALVICAGAFISNEVYNRSIRSSCARRPR